jgi:toxin-antitoxin system PIN domain toxin
VIVVDANVLIYAYNSTAPQHEAARRWVEDAFAGAEGVALPWAVVHAFLRLVTSNRVLPQPMTMEDALGIVDEWLDQPSVRVLEPSSEYWAIFRQVLIGARVHGPLVTDAHLAALALDRDAAVCTADRDFRRFAGVRVIDPLAG